MACALAQSGFFASRLRSRSSVVSTSNVARRRLVLCHPLREQSFRRLNKNSRQRSSDLCLFCWNNSLDVNTVLNGIGGERKLELDENPSIEEPCSSSLPEAEAAAAAAVAAEELTWWMRLRKVDWIALILKSSPYEQKLWTVPWSGQTIFQVMFLWFAAFWIVGSWCIPLAAHFAGFTKESLTYRGQALYSLVTDIAEGTVGLGILHRCLSNFQRDEEWFPIKWRGGWYLEACLGCLVFPLVNRLSQINLDLLPFPPPLTASNVEQSIMAKDPVATLLYAIVVAVCAPIWEEVIFRGFLLPSLTKYLPLWASILFSAIAFALAHFSPQRLMPLTCLGLIMGIVFVRNRNLLASILLHSLWNVSVFMDLLRT